ncbi:MAG: molybdopterin biosynthesis protein MoeY [Planctomycetes bacterium]|nr:molybdopterin biosynthesis protein MoeY [Planctomycetota bacterium]
MAAILDLARWAPSGDNAQPWSFCLTGPERAILTVRDQSATCLFERDGRCGLMSVGMLQENIRIAASTVARRIEWTRLGGGDRAPVFACTCPLDPYVVPDPLARWIMCRSVNRRTYATAELGSAACDALRAGLSPGFTLRLAVGRERRRWAWMNQRAARIRLDTREGFDLTRRIIDWGVDVSEERIPDRALGLPRIMLGIARLQLSSWSMTSFANRWLGGTCLPRYLLEWRPGLACAAHVAVEADRMDDSTDGWLRAGAAVQRFWLTATGLGLHHQPGMTPLIFARYVRDGIRFTDHAPAVAAAHEAADSLRHLLGPQALERAVWLGRIGYAEPASARSIRLPLERLVDGYAAETEAPCAS